VAVELVGYRQRGEVNTLWERDDQFRTHIEEQLGNDAAMAGVAVQFQYRSRKGEKYARIPRRSNYAPIFAETTALVRHTRTLGGVGAGFSFAESASRDMRISDGRPDHSQWITGQYPVLGEWFAAVDVRLYPSLKTAHASTTFHTMWVGLDEDELFRSVASHAQKIAEYRSATAAPVWLVIHSGSFPASTSFPSLQSAKAIEVANNASTIDGVAVFDGVLWLDGPNSSAGPHLWAVQHPLLLTDLGIVLGVPISPLDQ
jgi:hypothetical protein